MLLGEASAGRTAICTALKPFFQIFPASSVTPPPML